MSKAHHVSRFMFHSHDGEALALSVLSLTYSNGLAWWAHRRGALPDEAFRRLNVGVLALLLAYGALRPGGLHGIGFCKSGLGKSVAGGLVAGLGLSVPPLVFFYKPILLDTPLEYGPISGMTRQEMLLDTGVRIPLTVALFEELLFRGLLYSSLRRGHSVFFSLLANSAAFAGWHFAVTSASAAQSNLSSSARLPALLKPFVQPLAVLGGMLSTGAAGVAFGLVREYTGNLAGSIVAHWLVDSVMIFALWRRRTH